MVSRVSFQKWKKISKLAIKSTFTHHHLRNLPLHLLPQYQSIWIFPNSSVSFFLPPLAFVLKIEWVLWIYMLVGYFIPLESQQKTETSWKFFESFCAISKTSFSKWFKVSKSSVRIPWYFDCSWNNRIDFSEINLILIHMRISDSYILYTY